MPGPKPIPIPVIKWHPAHADGSPLVFNRNYPVRFLTDIDRQGVIPYLDHSHPLSAGKREKLEKSFRGLGKTWGFSQTATDGTASLMFDTDRIVYRVPYDFKTPYDLLPEVYEEMAAIGKTLRKFPGLLVVVHSNASQGRSIAQIVARGLVVGGVRPGRVSYFRDLGMSRFPTKTFITLAAGGAAER